MINALSIDLEYWYSAELVRKKTSEKDIYLNDLECSVLPLLELLDMYHTKATFFILGAVAEEQPDIIRKIHNRGHEIASHGYSHIPLYELGKKGFEDELKKSLQVINSIIDEEVIGFRAPSFSIDPSTKWAFQVLEEYGFRYDSSIFPMKTKLYGVKHAPISIYKPSKEDITRHDESSMLIEFPLTVYKSVLTLPISGGFYFRLFPYFLLKYWYHQINKKRPFVLYFHPWELSIDTPRIELPIVDKFITYHGIKSALSKFEILLQDFKFKPIKDILGL
jgi:polysaccharide deacetylase family protein (PEP-CTERM system associated)